MRCRFEIVRLRYVIAIAFCIAGFVRAQSPSAENPASLPLGDGNLRLAVFGDAGRGSKDQYQLADLLAGHHRSFPFEAVLTTGDNIYGKENAEGFRRKFEVPYRPLLDSGVTFFATLGNHDSSDQKHYPLFNMNGQEYYRVQRKGVSIYALNTKDLDAVQVSWLKEQLQNDANAWRIAFFHHPPFSSGGRHGSDEKVRRILHPLFVANGVDIVFNGHDHFYERVKPQDGITYFVTGAAGKIREGDLKDDSPLTAKGFDSDLSFMLVEFAEDRMHFQVISRTGAVVDAGVIDRRD